MNNIIRNTAGSDDTLIIQNDLPESLCHLQSVAVQFALLHKALKDFTTNTGSVSLVTEQITMNATSTQGPRTATERAYRITDIGEHTITIKPNNAVGSFSIQLVVRTAETGITADFYVIDQNGAVIPIENSTETSVQKNVQTITNNLAACLVIANQAMLDAQNVQHATITDQIEASRAQLTSAASVLNKIVNPPEKD
jgi:hypothetical protein